METQIIAFANQKGGCGKTTSAVNIAASLVALGFSVCLVDTDEQCNSTSNFGFEFDDEADHTVVDIYLAKKPAESAAIDLGERFENRFWIVRGHRGLSSVPHTLQAQLQSAIASDEEKSELDADDIRHEHRLRLKRSLDSLRGRFDFVIIDTPPALGFQMTSSLIAADSYIIPIFASNHDMKGLEMLQKNIAKVRERYNTDLRLLGVLLGNVDARTKLDRDVEALLIRKFGSDVVLKTVIHRGVKHREATFYHKTIIEHAPDEPASEQFLSATRELIERLKVVQPTPSVLVANHG